MSTLWNGFYLATRYIRFAPVRTLILVLGISVALGLPIFTAVLADRVESTLMARAQATPLILGHKGNEFDLTMTALYFKGQVKDKVPLKLRKEITDLEYGSAIPIDVSYSSNGVPIVGTSLEYFEQRNLTITHGRQFAVIGELVAGSQVADDFQLSIGDIVRSDLTNLYNIAGSYPTLLKVVGILETKGTSDDEAFFTDIKTVFVLDGSLHGHSEVTKEDALNPDASEDEVLEATAAIFIFNDITDKNINSYHMHGDWEEAHVGGILVFPKDQKAYDQILGDFALNELYQAISPIEVMKTILGIVLRVKNALNLYFGVVASTTIAFFALIITLNLRLRKDELNLMQKMGCSRFTIVTNLGMEITLIFIFASIFTALATFVGTALLDNLLLRY